jgi:uncharacterized protein
MQGRATFVKCPNCDRMTRYDPANAFRPFCSERCKLIDLGQWAAERYRVAGEEHPADPEDEPSSD